MKDFSVGGVGYFPHSAIWCNLYIRKVIRPRGEQPIMAPEVRTGVSCQYVAKLVRVNGGPRKNLPDPKAKQGATCLEATSTL